MKTPTKKEYRWVVTAVDSGDSCDGKARVLKCFRTKKAAENYVEKDMEGFVADSDCMGLEVDYGRMSAHTKDYHYGCEWSVERVQV